jgi:hypothetical protein
MFCPGILAGHSIGLLKLILIAALVVSGFVLQLTLFGRSVYAIGSNDEAARLSGVPVKAYTTIVSAELSAGEKHALVGSGFLLPTGIQGGGYIAVPGGCTISLIAKIPPGLRLDDVRVGLETATRAASMDSASNCSFSTRRLAIIRSAANRSRASSTRLVCTASFPLFAPFGLSGETLKRRPIGRSCRYSRRSAFRASILRRGISGSATRLKRALAFRTTMTASLPSLHFWREPIVASRFVRALLGPDLRQGQLPYTCPTTCLRRRRSFT